MSEVRTIEDIVVFYREESKHDLLGFTGDVVLYHLPAEQLSEFVEKVPDDWQPRPLERDVILAAMRDYMEFAWTKVQDHRGISANRSVEKMAAWLYLLKDDEMRLFATNGEHYAQYGAPILKEICEKYQFAIPDDPALERMAKGLPCHDGCAEGCG